MIAKDKNKNYEQGRMFVIFFFGKKKWGKKQKEKKERNITSIMLFVVSTSLFN